MKMCVSMIIALPMLLCTLASAAVSEAARSAVEAARSYGAAVRSCDMGWALDSMYPPLKKTYAEKYANRSGKEADNARIIMGLTDETSAEARARQQAALKALRELYVRMGEQMKSSGIKIESFTVREPVSEYIVTPPSGIVKAARRDSQGRISADNLQGEAERSRLVVLPITLIISGPAPGGAGITRMERRSHIYAIRDEVVSGTIDRNGFTKRDTKLNKWYFVDGNTDTNVLRAFFPNLPVRLRLPDGGERVLR